MNEEICDFRFAICDLEQLPESQNSSIACKSQIANRESQI